MLRNIALGDTVKIGHVECTVVDAAGDIVECVVRMRSLDKWEALETELDALDSLIKILAGEGTDFSFAARATFIISRDRLFEGADGKWRIKEQQRGDDYPWELL